MCSIHGLVIKGAEVRVQRLEVAFQGSEVGKIHVMEHMCVDTGSSTCCADPRSSHNTSGHLDEPPSFPLRRVGHVSCDQC